MKSVYVIPIILIIFLSGCAEPTTSLTAKKGLIISGFSLSCGEGKWCSSIKDEPGSEVVIMANVTNNEDIDAERVFIELYNLYDLMPIAGTEIKQKSQSLLSGDTQEFVWYLKIKDSAPKGTKYAVGVRICYSYSAHSEKDIMFVDRDWDATLPPLIDIESKGPIKITTSWMGSDPVKIALGQSKKIDIKLSRVAAGFVASGYDNEDTYGERDKLKNLTLTFNSQNMKIMMTEGGHFGTVPSKNCNVWFDDDPSGEWTCVIDDPSTLKMTKGTERTLSFFMGVNNTETNFEVSTRMRMDANYKFCVEGDKYLNIEVIEYR